MNFFCNARHDKRRSFVSRRICDQFRHGCVVQRVVKHTEIRIIRADREFLGGRTRKCSVAYFRNGQSKVHGGNNDDLIFVFRVDSRHGILIGCRIQRIQQSFRSFFVRNVFGGKPHFSFHHVREGRNNFLSAPFNVPIQENVFVESFHVVGRADPLVLRIDVPRYIVIVIRSLNIFVIGKRNEHFVRIVNDVKIGIAFAHGLHFVLVGPSSVAIPCQNRNGGRVFQRIPTSFDRNGF